MDAESQRSPYTGIKGHRQTDTEISINGHKMDANGIYGHKIYAESQRSPYTGIKGHRQTDTEISIYGHKMDANRQISPYMGIWA